MTTDKAKERGLGQSRPADTLSSGFGLQNRETTNVWCQPPPVAAGSGCPRRPTVAPAGLTSRCVASPRPTAQHAPPESVLSFCLFRVVLGLTRSPAPVPPAFPTASQQCLLRLGNRHRVGFWCQASRPTPHTSPQLSLPGVAPPATASTPPSVTQSERPAAGRSRHPARCRRERAAFCPIANRAAQGPGRLCASPAEVPNTACPTPGSPCQPGAHTPAGGDAGLSAAGLSVGHRWLCTPRPGCHAARCCAPIYGTGVPPRGIPGPQGRSVLGHT